MSENWKIEFEEDAYIELGFYASELKYLTSAKDLLSNRFIFKNPPYPIISAPEKKELHGYLEIISHFVHKNIFSDPSLEPS